MRFIIMAIGVLAVTPALAQEVQQDNIGSPACVDVPFAASTECFELLVQGMKDMETFDVLTIGRGGRICGPATVRAFKEGEPALELGPGVCIPAMETKVENIKPTCVVTTFVGNYCSELLSQSANESEVVNVFSIDLNGRVCGPATATVFKDGRPSILLSPALLNQNNQCVSR